MNREKLSVALRYGVAGFALVGTGLAAAAGASSLQLLAGLALALFLLMGLNRQFGAGVTRTEDAIVCRYQPWREGNVYGLVVLLPLVLAGLPAASAFARYGTYIYLAIIPLMLWAFARMSRNCRLRIDRSSLTVNVHPGVFTNQPAPIVIHRSDIEAITLTMVYPGTQRIFQVPQVTIARRSADRSHAPNVHIGPVTVRGDAGLYLSVKPANLHRALIEWKDGSADDPALLDRTEALLRGRPSTASV